MNLDVGKGDTMEGKQESTILKKANQSWVEKAQDKKSLKKYKVEVSTKKGKHKVDIPDSNFGVYAIVGRFCGWEISGFGSSCCKGAYGG